MGQPVVRPLADFHARAAQWLFVHFSGVFLSLARDLFPIVARNGKATVTRYDDVKEVFLADDVFGMPYAEKLGVITGGVPFLLARADTPGYRNQREAMRKVFRAGDIERRLVPRTEAAAERIVAAGNGRIDVVELSRNVSTEILLDYFGTPAPRDGDIEVWGNRLFESLVHFGKDDRDLAREVSEYAPALLKYVQDLIDARKETRKQAAGNHGVSDHDLDDDDDVLGRCLTRQARDEPGFTDPEIRAALAGFIVAGPPQPPIVIPKALEQLLRRPKILAEAQAAARRDDDETLRKYLFEAMRFDPLAPLLHRVAKRDHLLADGTLRVTKIKAGTDVKVFFSSAMMDHRRVPDPKSFNPDRPDSNYLLFGYGLHQCFGYHINRRVLPVMLKPLLKRARLRRADGPEGHLRKQGFFPEHLVVAFEA